MLNHGEHGEIKRDNEISPCPPWFKPFMTSDKTTLLEFPTPFPIKIMGEAQDGFAQAIVAIVVKHAPGFDPANTEMRPSKQGRYLGITCTITATSQAQLDALYRELSAHPLVKMVL